MERKPIMSSKNAPWFMLFSRIILFAGIQALLALGFYLTDSAAAWEASAAWWPLTVTLTNLICVALLVRIFRLEGRRYRDIFLIQRKYILRDLLVILGLFIIAGPVSFFPNPMLSKALFGDPQAVLPLLVRPLPLWVVYAFILLFPITQGLAELPTYFGYVMPRFESNGMRPWLAITLPSLMLGLQHIAVPLLFDVRYILWRGLMFIPFAFFVGIVLHWRPRFLPYMVVVHVLMDMAFAAMLLGAAY
jgi:membrane protease YdiL (CAAX protease family)